MKKIIKLTTWIVGSLILSLIFSFSTSAQSNTSPPITINLLADKTSYLPDEPIKIQITVANNSGQDVIARKGFLGQDFQLLITFTDPDGNFIRHQFQGVAPGEPLPSRMAFDAMGVLSGVATVEMIPPPTTEKPLAAMSVMGDAHSYYPITKPGSYKAQVFTSLEIFSKYFTDKETGDLLSPLDDPGRQNFDPLTSNEISFQIAQPQVVSQSSIKVKVNLLKIGHGEKPRVTKKPLANIPVYLYRKSDIPQDFYPINFKTYGLIFEQVAPIRLQNTDPHGIARFPGILQNDYIVIALYDNSPDFRHMGSQVSATEPEWGTTNPIVRHLMVMEKTDGKKLPCKTIMCKGSKLLIIEPEYIEWDEKRELCPFVFQSTGNWTVTTSISRHGGFVANPHSLTERVRNEIEAVQFIIRHRGWRWDEMEVTYRIEHRGEKEVIESEIGVKLSKKLCREEGLGHYGHTWSPGTFKGGRRVWHEREK